jgi:hypothetical protein
MTMMLIGRWFSLPAAAVWRCLERFENSVAAARCNIAAEILTRKYCSGDIAGSCGAVQGATSKKPSLFFGLRSSLYQTRQTAATCRVRARLP